jgi:hypothetical protein
MPPDSFRWVYDVIALVGIDDAQWDSKTITGVTDLLQALIYYDAPLMSMINTSPGFHDFLTGRCIHLLCKSLSVTGNISSLAAHLLIRKDVLDWFRNSETRAVLQEASVWSSLARFSLELQDYVQFTTEFILRGWAIAIIPDWQPHVRRELCSWIAAFFRGEIPRRPRWDLSKEYISVLKTVWVFTVGDYAFTEDEEEALGLSFVALTNLWDGFDFRSSGNFEHASAWLRCTGYAIRSGYHTRHSGWTPISSSFQTGFGFPLARSLLRASERARETFTINSTSDPNNPGTSLRGADEDAAARTLEPCKRWQRNCEQLIFGKSVTNIQCSSGTTITC